MSEPPNPLWTLGAVVLGGFLTIVGQIIADQVKFRQVLRREQRDRLREQLYVLQDHLMEVFEKSRAVVRNLNDPLNPGYKFFMDTRDLKNAIGRTGSYTVRVGDDSLANHIEACIKELFAATQPKNDGYKALLDANGHLERAQLSIGELLHTNTPVDLGIASVGRKSWFRQSN